MTGGANGRKTSTINNNICLIAAKGQRNIFTRIWNMKEEDHSCWARNRDCSCRLFEQGRPTREEQHRAQKQKGNRTGCWCFRYNF